MTRDIFVDDAYIQKAIYDILRVDSPLAELFDGQPILDPNSTQRRWIGDFIPGSTDLPYVAFGNDDLDQFDDKTAQGVQANITIDLYSSYRGRLIVKQGMARIRKLLTDQQLPMTSAHTIQLYHDRSHAIQESDGRTWHGITTYRLLANALPES